MDKQFRLWGLVCALAASSATLAQSNAAAVYPVRAIHWIVPGAPGSPPDIIARIVGESLAAKLGQPVIVENRPGASGTIALAAVAKSAPDGYTLAMFSVPQMVAPSLTPALGYDTARDFASVIQLVQTRHLLLVRADSPIRSFGELVSFAKANPGRMTFASAGNGGLPHLAGELLRQRAGIDIRHIPYKSGPFAVTALLAGEVDMLFITHSTAAVHLKSGKLRALVTLAPARLPGYPEVPTVAEVGFPSLEMADWFGIAVPAGTPKSIVDRLSVAAREAVASGEAGGRLSGAGMTPVLDSSPDQFAALVRSELLRWAALVREAGIHAD